MAQRRPFTGAWIETNDFRAANKAFWRRPFTGAWIETHLVNVCGLGEPGRPFTGAWIETTSSCTMKSLSTVAPSRGRGLKLEHYISMALCNGRPFTGAWIET